MLVGIGHCNGKDPFLSGQEVARLAMEKADIESPDLVIAFCHGQMDHSEFLDGIRAVVGPSPPVIGGSAIGVITNDYVSYTEYPSCAAIIECKGTRYSIGWEDGIDIDEKGTGRNLAAKLSPTGSEKLLFTFYDSI